MAFDHREGGAAANPYAPVMGRTFVAVDETAGPLGVLDERRAALLTAWVGELIPGDDAWPSAADPEIAAAAYVDAVLQKAPTLRPVILAGIDEVDAVAFEEQGSALDELERDDRVALLRRAEEGLAPEAFSVLFELTYEAYYRSPSVQAIVKERTGFDVRNTVVGKPMKPFPEEKLLEVSSRPDRYRSVPA